MSEDLAIVELRSAAPEATHVQAQEGVSSVKASVVVTFTDFMDPDYLEDCIDLLAAKQSVALAGTTERIPWEDLKQQLGL